MHTWGPTYIRIDRKIRWCFQLLVISSTCLQTHFMDLGLHRTNGREILDCKRNKCFLVGKYINACIFIVILLCPFVMGLHGYFFLKESKKKIKHQTRTIHIMKPIFFKMYIYILVVSVPLCLTH